MIRREPASGSRSERKNGSPRHGAGSGDFGLLNANAPGSGELQRVRTAQSGEDGRVIRFSAQLNASGEGMLRWEWPSLWVNA